MSSVPREAFPRKYLPGLPPYDPPLILLARLAVDRRFAGRGLGYTLVSEAFRISLRAANEIGCRCIVTDAYPDRIGWYAQYGFVSIEGARVPDHSECFSTSALCVPRQSNEKRRRK